MHSKWKLCLTLCFLTGKLKKSGKKWWLTVGKSLALSIVTMLFIGFANESLQMKKEKKNENERKLKILKKKWKQNKNLKIENFEKKMKKKMKIWKLKIENLQMKACKWRKKKQRF